MAKPLLILLKMANSNQPHMDNLRLLFLMVDDHIRISMPELNDEDYFPPVLKLDGNENEEGPSDNDPP